MVRFFLSLSLFHALPAFADCGEDAARDQKAIERLNRRYDDFFKNQAHEEEREVLRNRGRHDLHGAEHAREAARERARLAFIKQRRAPVDHDAELERQMAQVQAKHDQAMNEARSCYRRRQAQIESTMRRGRMIPEKKEFDLEDDGL